MANQPIEVHEFTVEEGGHKMRVMIPKSEDKSYDNYLIEAEKEKTRDQLKHKPIRQEPKPGSRSDLVGMLKEQQEYRRRKADSPNKRYF